MEVEGRWLIVLGRTSPVSICAYITSILSSLRSPQFAIWPIMVLTTIITYSMSYNKKLTKASSCLVEKNDLFEIQLGVGLVLAIFVFWIIFKNDNGRCLICDQAHNLSCWDEIGSHVKMLPATILQHWVYTLTSFLSMVSFSFSYMLRFSCVCLLFLVPIFCFAVLFMVIGFSLTCLLTIMIDFFCFCPMMSFLVIAKRHFGDRVQSIQMMVKYCYFINNFLGDLFALAMAILKDLANSSQYIILVAAICFNIWGHYVSFCRKYDNLVLNLYKHWNAKTSGLDNALEFNPRDDSILKGLFQEACNRLTGYSILENISKWLVNTILIVVFMYLALSYIMATPTVSESLKVFVALLTTVFPRVYKELISCSPETEKIQDEILDNRVKSVICEYFDNIANDVRNKGAERDADFNLLQTTFIIIGLLANIVLLILCPNIASIVQVTLALWMVTDLGEAQPRSIHAKTE